MDYTGLALVITALGTLAVSLSSAVAAMIAAYFAAKAHAVAARAAQDINRVEVATNGMKDELVKATQVAGELQGRADQRAENEKGKPRA